MERYFKRKYTSDVQPPIQDRNARDQVEHSSKLIRLDDLSNLPTDPGLRIQISDYHADDQVKIRTEYLQLGPCQPRDYEFPTKKIGKRLRRFNSSWFTEFGSWLEYSVAKDAAFCFHCYLFGTPSTGQQGGGDVFVDKGFTNWEKSETFRNHVGGTNSAHNQAYMKTRDFINQEHHKDTFFPRKVGETQTEYDYRIRLSASVTCMQCLLRQGLIFHGIEESEDSNYPGIFFDLLQLLAKCSEGIKKVILQNAPENLRLITHDIQKDIVNAAGIETLNIIREDLRNSLFAVLIGECSDGDLQVKLSVFIRYVDKRGYAIERFIGIMDRQKSEASTTISLNSTLETLFSKFGLSSLNLRGLVYYGFSKMRSELNGFNSLIQQEKKSAYNVHCFAHHLHVDLINVVQGHLEIARLFKSISKAVSVIGASSKDLDIDRKKQAVEIVENLKSELSGNHGFNKDTGLEEYDETHGTADYRALIGLIVKFSSVIDMLEFLEEFGPYNKGEACWSLDGLLSFDSIFCLHLVQKILGITDCLARVLLHKDQNIVNAVNLMKISKQLLQMMRENGWDELFTKVSSFCVKHDLIIPDMDENYNLGASRRRRADITITNIHHYQVELFHNCIDLCLEELNRRFDDVNMELFLCMSSLNPSDSFAAFDKQKLIRLAQFYPDDFSASDLVALPGQLDSYITDMHSNDEFSKVDGINGLVQKMIETKRHIKYPSVFLLMTLFVTLPVATASVERAFSTMRTVKNFLPKMVGDEWMNACLVTYIESDIFGDIERDVIMKHMENMRMTRGQV